MIHKTVLLQQAIDGLNLKTGSIFFDGTLGGAGHSLKVCSDFGSTVRIIGTDRDTAAVNNAYKTFTGKDCSYDFVNSDYRRIDLVLKKLDIKSVDAILLDLGLSSDQLESSGRGFSFKRDEPLLMTFSENPNSGMTAEEILNYWKEENIADIIYAYADERYSKRIAKAIIESRKEKPIKTTNDLIRIIEKAVPAGYRKGKIHFATKTFQGLRVAVNDEIGALKEGMERGWDLLNKNGRMAIISFHSVEDREVKNFYKEKVKEKSGKLINKKPILPSDDEVKSNPRSRSAKLRIIEKIK